MKSLSMMPEGMEWLPKHAKALVKSALAEDLGTGDLTTEAIVKKGSTGKAVFIAREPFTVAGLFVAEAAFKALSKNTSFVSKRKDGDKVRRAEPFATVEGDLRAILSAERVALNFLQRLSGIATVTAEFVKRSKGRAGILDTRKTTPCLRMLEKYAVRAGGGFSHRSGLYDMVLIKDNHIAAAGGVAEAVRLSRERHGEKVPVEVEVTNSRELKEALASGADIIMLDNMGPEKIKKAVRLIGGRALTEASGGVGLDNIARLAATGVDFVSIGALTHSARAVDISLEMVAICGKPPRK